MRSACLVFCLLCMPILPAAADTRIVALDWTHAEILTALGQTPLGVAQIPAYRRWVGAPQLGDQVRDLGLRAQPNLELLSALHPDLILTTALFAHLESRLGRIAPVQRLPVYIPERPFWPQLIELTRHLARLSGRQAEGEALLAETESRLTAIEACLHTLSLPPLLLVQPVDAHHVRVFGRHSLYQAVLDRLGLRNAWHQGSNAWGYRVVGIEALAETHARILIIEPVPFGIEARLERNPLWQYVSSRQTLAPQHLGAIWSQGGPVSAQRFAEELERVLLPPASCRNEDQQND